MKLFYNFGKRTMLFLFAALLTAPALAQQGYAVYDNATKTLSFHYGIPTGVVNVDYYDTDNTPTSFTTSRLPWYQIASKCEHVVFDPAFTNARPTSCAKWFEGFNKITEIQGLEYLNTESVISFSDMFCSCHKLTSLDLSHFNTENATDFSNMFLYCYGLTELDLSSFKTPKAYNFNKMFGQCQYLETIVFPNIDTKQARFFNSMFVNCKQLKNLDVSHFDTSNAEDLKMMFNGCKSLTKLDVSNFATKNMKFCQEMFKDCVKLTSITFGPDFSFENLKTNSSYSMFSRCTSLRYIDFSAANHTDAISSVNRSNESNTFFRTPRTTVIYLPHGSQTVTDAENVVYSYNGDQTDLRCPKYYSEDKVDIEFPYDFITHEAEYKRSTANEKGTVILPYAFTSNTSIQAYTLQKEYDNFMWFESTETVPAHTPFVFRNLNGSTTADFTQTDASQNFGITVYATRDTELHPDGPYTASANLSGWTMKGYYVNQSVDSYSNLYYVQNDHFTRANGETLQFPPHRVTFHGAWAISPSGSPAGAPSYEIKFIDNNTTAIESIETDNTGVETKDIFDTSGRRLATLKKGVNIIRLNNGTTKKVIIK